jgi:hypothetical protein
VPGITPAREAIIQRRVMFLEVTVLRNGRSIFSRKASTPPPALSNSVHLSAAAAAAIEPPETAEIALTRPSSPASAR